MRFQNEFPIPAPARGWLRHLRGVRLNTALSHFHSTPAPDRLSTRYVIANNTGSGILLRRSVDTGSGNSFLTTLLSG